MAIGVNWKDIWAPVWDTAVWDQTAGEAPIGVNWSPIWKQVWGPVWQASASGAATISAAYGTPTGGTTATVGCTTDTASGTLYWAITESATPPSIADIKAGTGAAAFGSVAVSSTSPSASATGLVADTQYWVHFVQTVSAVDSAVESSDDWWTDNTGSGGGELDVLTGDLAATEGADSASFAEAGAVIGNLAATESGGDSVAFAAAVAISGAFSASESGADQADFVGEVVGAPRMVVKKRGHAHGWVRARQRMALQTWIDYLTKEEPAESTKQVIKEVKAGRPIPNVKPPKGPAEISAEKLAEKILPGRLWEAKSLVSDNVDVQRVVMNAIRIAQERDDEDVLLLL